MGTKTDKFILLMWKNWLLQWRHPIQTLMEILAPVLFSALLVLIRGLVDPEEHSEIIFPPFDVSKAMQQPPPGLNFANYTLAFSPYNPILAAIVINTAQSLGINASVIPLRDSRDLEFFFQNDIVYTGVLAGIQFDDNLRNATDIPSNTKIALRFPGELRHGGLIIQNSWLTNMLFPTYQMPGPRSPYSLTTAAPSYYDEGFLGLQRALTYSMISYFENEPYKPPNITMRRFPYPKWIDDPLLKAMQSFVGIIIMLSFVYPCINTVRVITTEKERQLKEAMKIMGLPNWLHWTAWFVKTFAFLLISIILMVILLKVPWFPSTDFSVFTKSNPFVMLLFLLLYICATITFCFAISVFFTKANVAAAIGGLAWFLSYAPYLFLQEQYDSLSLGVKMVSSLGSNTAMAYGFQLMLMFEGIGEGLQWHNIFRATSPDDNLTLAHVMLMLIIDTIIYLLVALYVEAIMPGEYGVPKVWYFPFTSAYWCGQPRDTGVKDHPETPQNRDFYEKEPADLLPGIQIKHLHKKYSNEKVAVRDLSLNMYRGQITVLLGHNGAGKTTTMSMLTGMFPPSGGTALVNGYDVCTEMDRVRESLGLCPQHNILFDELTVEEHIYFYSKLKGLAGSQIKSEVKKYVDLLELQPKAKSQSKTLSGGMKRKLSVGVALCGNSKVVMLDEPTAGMDPSARRALWELLQKQKEGRTLLLTTHFMDEADVLGDRIAIMAGGKLQCCGSSFFLKKKYGAGYHLVMDIGPNCVTKNVTRLMQKHIPKIQMESNFGSELVYLLNESDSAYFEPMLRELEENSEQLDVRSYGISLTTLEEVFMKVGADHGQEEINNDSERNNAENQNNNHQNNYGNDNITDSKVEIVQQQLLTGFKLKTNQILAMFMKKSLSTLRSWLLLLIQIIIPVTFLIIAIVVTRITDNKKDIVELPFTLGAYDNPVTVINGSNKYRDEYVKLIESSHHLLQDYKNDQLADHILKLTSQNTATVRLRYIVGSTFDSSDSITAWFNNEPYHSPPLALKLALDAVTKTELGPSYSIDITNHPLPFTIKTKFKMLSQTSNMGFQLAFNIGFSMAFVSSFYILFYIRERESKSKHLQFVSGVEVFTFWTVSFIWDFFTFIITTLAVLITLAAFQEDGFSTAEQLGRIFLIFLYFGFAMLPMIYLFAFKFNIPSSGYTKMSFFSIFTGVAAFMVVQVLATEGLDLEYIADALHWVFLLVPHYSLATGIRDSHSIFAVHKLCHSLVEMCEEIAAATNNHTIDCWKQVCEWEHRCYNADQSYFTWESPGILRNIIFSFLVGCILFLFLFLIELNVFNKLIYKVRHYYLSPPADNEAEDDDVVNEKRKIRAMTGKDINDHAIVLKDVTKYYKKFLAVNNLCLGVKSHECFGLLGVNGAGKTTTFKMMTGDVPISFGDIWVTGYDLKQQLKKIQQNIGYCPQFDALLDDLTGRETMLMFCLLRGVPRIDCEYIIQKLAKDLDFHRHLNKKVKEYSGGNKRKLSTAIALIGDPPILYLDEPTTGMDPATKRHLWNVLCQVRENGKCIVLTSHSMEECEALCTRLAIMVNGKFKCLGSTQHLKSKFSEGYMLMVKIKKTSDINVVRPEDVKVIENFVKQNFPNAVLREKYQELLSYYISDKTLSWSKMFGIMERGKQSLNIEDYSLGQSNLEQVFLSFTKQQRPE